MVAICTSLNFDFRMTLPLLGAMHYTDCPLFSPLRLRVDREQSSQSSAWGPEPLVDVEEERSERGVSVWSMEKHEENHRPCAPRRRTYRGNARRHPTSMTTRQWSLGPHSSRSLLRARTRTASTMLFEAKM